MDRSNLSETSPQSVQSQYNLLCYINGLQIYRGIFINAPEKTPTESHHLTGIFHMAIRESPSYNYNTKNDSPKQNISLLDFNFLLYSFYRLWYQRIIWI
mgnify:CR=1 FL=1